MVGRQQFFAGLLALVLAACGPEMTIWDAADEARIGASEHANIVEKYGGVYENAALTAYVERVMARVAAASDKPDADYHITLLDSPVVNALALPGGYNYVTRGFLALADSEAELAGVIGHELGHITARHSAQRHTAAAMVGVLGLILDEVVDDDDRKRASKILAVGSGLVLLRYSREHEYEADNIGVHTLARAGYAPIAKARILHAIGAYGDLQGARGDDLPLIGDWLSTHPNSEARVARMRDVAAVMHLAESTSGDDAFGGVSRGELGRDRYLDAIDGMAYGETEEGVSPRYVRVMRVQRGDTLDMLADWMEIDGTAQEKAALLRVLNGLEAGRSPEVGRRIKLIRR